MTAGDRTGPMAADALQHLASVEEAELRARWLRGHTAAALGWFRDTEKGLHLNGLAWRQAVRTVKESLRVLERIAPGPIPASIRVETTDPPAGTDLALEAIERACRYARHLRDYLEDIHSWAAGSLEVVRGRLLSLRKSPAPATPDRVAALGVLRKVLSRLRRLAGPLA